MQFVVREELFPNTGGALSIAEICLKHQCFEFRETVNFLYCSIDAAKTIRCMNERNICFGSRFLVPLRITNVEWTAKVIPFYNQTDIIAFRQTGISRRLKIREKVLQPVKSKKILNVSRQAIAHNKKGVAFFQFSQHLFCLRV